ncbi:MAG: HNH endonuclease [Variovorax sp.]
MTTRSVLVTSPRAALTASRLRELLDYDPVTGVFRHRRQYVGQVAGSMSTRGYLRIYVDQKDYYAHRLAWLFMTGEWPVGQIDHVDGEKRKNSFANLREATPAQNQQNIWRPSIRNATGYRGVSLHESGSFVAQISTNGRRRYLGIFATVEAASEAYMEAKRQEHTRGAGSRHAN